MYNKLPNFSQNLKCAISVLYLFITVFTPNTCQSKAQGLCPMDWTFSQYSGTCVSERSNLLSQSSARSQCNSLGADLVTILSSDMNEFLHDYLKTKSGDGGVWIGLRRQSGKFRWLDSNNMPSYFSWYTRVSEPSGEECVQINNSGAKDHKAWMDVTCDLLAAYICEKLQSPMCPFGWIWSDSSWSCIKLFLNELTWNDARDTCNSNQADLLVIPNMELNIFLDEVLSGHKYDYWIGLNDKKTENVYRWLDNDEEAQYVKMDLGLSNDGDCGQVRRPLDGWSLHLCGQRKKFICERMTVCPESRYGFKCSLNCSENCKGPENSCDMRDGKCTHGCKDGYTGEMCDTEFSGEDTNVTQSSEGDKNFTKKQEGIDHKAPSMLKAYLASFLFAVVVIGFFFIPQCMIDLETYRDSIQDEPQEDVAQLGEENIKDELFADAVFENFPYGESSVNMAREDPTVSRTKVVQPDQSVYSVTRVYVE